MSTSWTADSGDVTADSALNTADGASFDTGNAAPYLALITSEHNKKDKFMSLVGAITSAFADIIATAKAIQPAYDLDLAVGAQLDVLGKWIGQSRTVSQVLVFGYFGFQDNASALPFGELNDPSIGGRFYELGATYSGDTVLSDLDYRTVLKARIIRNQAHGTIMDLENSLSYVFGASAAVIDNGNLSFGIVVNTPITQTQRTLLSTLDILPRPAGVSISSITYSP